MWFIEKIIKFLDKLLIKNISFIFYIAISIIAIIFCIGYIEITLFIPTIWWIFAFWYWYKKYERDKDLEMINKYLVWELVIEDDLSKVRNWKIWYQLFTLWYISNDIWKIIENENKNILFNFFIINIQNNLDKDFSTKITDYILDNDKNVRKYFIDIIKWFLSDTKILLKNNKINEEEEKSYEKVKFWLISLLSIIEVLNKQYDLD